MTTLRTCIECGTLAPDTRCPDCTTEQRRRRGSGSAQGYGQPWQTTSTTLRRRHPRCTLCGTTTDLTVDHVVAKVEGGSDEPENLRVLCRECNGRLGGIVSGRQRRRRPGVAG